MNPYKREYTEELLTPKCNCNKKPDILLIVSLYTVFFCIVAIFTIEVCKALRIFTTIEVPVDGRITILLLFICLGSLFFGLGLSKWRS